MNMNFQFDSLSDFWQMSGHGPFVWACYLVTALAIGYLLIAPIMAKKQFMKRLARQERLAQVQPRSRANVASPEQKEGS